MCGLIEFGSCPFVIILSVPFLVHSCTVKACGKFKNIVWEVTIYSSLKILISLKYVFVVEAFSYKVWLSAGSIFFLNMFATDD